MLDQQDLQDLVCVPRSGGINVQQLRHLRPDGTEAAFAERLSKGFGSKLARYTGMDLGKDRRVLVRAGQGEPFLAVTCRTRSAETGLAAELEQPVGTDLREIRIEPEGFALVLTGGRRAGMVARPDDPGAPRAIRDGEGRSIGDLTAVLPGQERITLLGLAADIDFLDERQGTQSWTSSVKAVRLRLASVPPEPLRSFAVAMPVVLALGHRNPTSWDGAEW